MACRMLLFGIGQRVHGGKTPDGYVKSKGGFRQREIEAVCAAGGKLSLAAVLRCRVRYFTDGVVLGSQSAFDAVTGSGSSRISIGSIHRSKRQLPSPFAPVHQVSVGDAQSLVFQSHEYKRAHGHIRIDGKLYELLPETFPE